MNKLFRYLIISLAVVVLFIGLGYLTYSITGTPFPAKEVQGGEISEFLGIGYTVEKYYPLVSADDIDQYTDSKFILSLTSIFAYIIIITAVQWVAAAVRRKSKQKTSNVKKLN